MNYELVTLGYIEQLREINPEWRFECDSDSQTVTVDNHYE